GLTPDLFAPGDAPAGFAERLGMLMAMEAADEALPIGALKNVARQTDRKVAAEDAIGRVRNLAAQGGEGEAAFDPRFRERRGRMATHQLNAVLPIEAAF